jgi:hypothetical protein
MHLPGGVSGECSSKLLFLTQRLSTRKSLVTRGCNRGTVTLQILTICFVDKPSPVGLLFSSGSSIAGTIQVIGVQGGNQANGLEERLLFEYICVMRLTVISNFYHSHFLKTNTKHRCWDFKHVRRSIYRCPRTEIPRAF